MSDLDLDFMRHADDSLDPVAHDAFLTRLEADSALRHQLVEHWLESAALRTALARPYVVMPRRWWRPKALLACGVAAVAAALVIMLFLPTPGPIRDTNGTAVASGPFACEHSESWDFRDGSRIAFSDGARGAASFSDSLTSIALVAGSADVSVHPQSSPDRWQVQVGPLAASVIGTRFSVQATPAGGRLALAEGSVDVSCPGGETGRLHAGRIAAGVAGSGWRSWPAPVHDGLLAVIIPSEVVFADALRGPQIALRLDGDPKPNDSGFLRLERQRTMALQIPSNLAQSGCSLVLWLTSLTRSDDNWMPLMRISTQNPLKSLTVGTERPNNVPMRKIVFIALILSDNHVSVVIDGQQMNSQDVDPALWAAAHVQGFELGIGQADDDTLPHAQWSLLVHRADVYRRALSLDECAVISNSGWRD